MTVKSLTQDKIKRLKMKTFHKTRNEVQLTSNLTALQEGAIDGHEISVANRVVQVMKCVEPGA